jgi:hypothetical protein
MSSRVDQAWQQDPRALWGLILEDEVTHDADELGEVAERLFANAQEAWAENARLRSAVYSLAGRLEHASAHAPPRGPLP